MTTLKSKSIAIGSGAARVSGLLLQPRDATACYVFAHGAGAGMEHPFMATLAQLLAQQGIATLRFQFLYMERASKRPDPPAVAHATIRAAVAEARAQMPELAMFAGGKSFGGRMTAQAQAAAPLEGVRGLAFVGFPLHPAKRPSRDRAQPLYAVTLPMLFLQGTRDALAEPAELAPVIAALKQRATLKEFADADHGFHVPKRSGRSDADVLAELATTLAAWTAEITGR
jgi:predicted alpha/beta-hydrolase family hydrolase